MIFIKITLLCNLLLIYLFLKIIINENKLFSVDNLVINFVNNYYIYLFLIILISIFGFFRLPNKLYISAIYTALYAFILFIISFFAFFLDNPASKTDIEFIIYFSSFVIMFLYIYMTIFYSKKENISIFNKAFVKKIKT